MKRFPSVTAVIGAWLCALGFVFPGIIAFFIASAYSVFVEEEIEFLTLAFLFANIVALTRFVYVTI